MRKLLITFCFIFVSLFLFSGDVHAQGDNGGTLRHAYKPETTMNGDMQARVDNFTTMQQKRLVCVEAWNNATGMRNHLGCLWVDLAPMGTMDASWATEFNVPTSWLSPGSYTVAYTYQDEWGNWHRIKSVTMQMSDGMYKAW